MPALPPWLPPLFYLLIAALFLWRSTFTGEVFLPAGMLGHVAPWTARAAGEPLPPWNPLRWDGIAQFYPWRHFAAETLRSGAIPLWNPYQFCGTPFVANSQSAVFYPGNLPFYLFPTALAFNVAALLHLTLCGWFTFLLLRRLRCTDVAALLGGIVYAYSAWEVAWLQLPTFLATSCWFPLLLRQVHASLKPPSPALPPRTGGGSSRGGGREMGSLALVIGMMLLAGHLQIAFYGLLAGSLWAVALLLARWRANGLGAAARGLAACVAALILGGMLALPQLLPSLELSRVSHRVGKPTAAGYTAYTEYAAQPEGLMTLMLPEFFGNDYDPNNPYWGYYYKKLPDGSRIAIRHNAAETAAYVGIVPLLLGVLALIRAVSRVGKAATELDEAEAAARSRGRYALFFGGLAALALLLALGTPLNALFYFFVPGFGQSGSPARSLVLWALAWAVLSGFGLNTLLRRLPTTREIAFALGALAGLFCLGLLLVSLTLASPPPQFSLPIPSVSEAFQRIGVGWARFAVAALGGAFLLLPAARRELRRGKAGSLPMLAPLALLLALADLFLVGIGVNPTAPPDAVYPETPGLKRLRERIGHDRIFPINQKWSLYSAPPAILPPNAATAYDLRDVQGYDSLFTGQYKAFANLFARPTPQGFRDASPPEVGNMVFFQNPDAPLVPTTGAAFALTPSLTSPAFVPEASPSGSPLYDADKEMAIYALPNARPRAALTAPNSPPVVWKEDGPTRVTLEVDAPAATTLYLADQFYPGWHATLDSQPVSISRQAQAPVFRAVAVPAGHHTVAFRYEPASFRIGLYLACLACLLLTAIRVARSPARK
ncbi:MAG TPA: hypothetical protein VFB21_20135 [Chthonomonadaceae bacterium]|nr:hypothetical protein [Chthonomonadaceae bacterium]